MPSSPLSLAQQVGSICDRFESAWKSGQRPTIEDHLATVPAEQRPSLLAALLRLEMELLARQPVCDYFPTGSGASEPSALAAIALIGHGRTMAAKPVGEFLVSLQTSFGCVGMRAKESEPHWATSLALLVWKWLGDKDYGRASDAALNWTLQTEGERIPRRPDLGHNSTLAAWPWVEGTHSWLEPSALFTIALKVYNLRDLPRTKEAVELLLDRLLPSGGCNYGNTTVLGQMLRPHVQPSG